MQTLAVNTNSNFLSLFLSIGASDKQERKLKLQKITVDNLLSIRLRTYPKLQKLFCSLTVGTHEGPKIHGATAILNPLNVNQRH